MKMRKWMSVTATVLVLSLLVVACSNNAGNSNNQTGVNNNGTKETNVDSEPKEGESSFKLKDPATITMMTIAAEVSKDLPVYQYIKEATNITVDGFVPVGDFKDALSLTVAGGDIPDIMYINDPGNVGVLPRQYGSMGVLLDFNEVIDKMPNLKQFWEKRPDLKARALTHDGKIYQVFADGLQYTNNLVWMYRKDIFEKHNIALPKTWDELYTVLQKLKELYPDSYPFTFRDKFANIDQRMLTTFGVKNDFHPTLDTREIIYGQTTDEYHSLIEYLNKFNAEKLINPDFLSITTPQWVELMTTGKGMIALDYIGRIQTVTAAMGVEGAQLAMMPPPQGGDGPAYITNMNYLPGGFTVYKNSKNLDATLHYIDFLFSDEGSELVSWGKEGETYKIVDGKKELIVGVDTLSLRQETGIGGFGSYGKFDATSTKSFLPEQYAPYYEEVEQYIYPEDIIPAFSDTEQQLLAITLDQLNKHRESTIARFILGERPLDEWDQYVEEMNKLGLSKLIELHGTAFERVLD